MSLFGWHNTLTIKSRLPQVTRYDYNYLHLENPPTSKMLFSSVFLAFALSAVGIAQEVDNNDVPNECRDVCASIVSLARRCGDQFGA
jgi:hypothetical protein